ncbi:MAG TPA: hypothetical protein VFG14_09450, partial [Chthoniobacteraceae bacterium]|nr:hypothetical protein [Chthoniobacteraceae bacterium]
SLAGTLAIGLAIRSVIVEPLDRRHLVPLVPIAVLFAMAGLNVLHSRIVHTNGNGAPKGSLAWSTLVVVALTTFGLLTAQLFTPESMRQRWTGYAEGAQQIVADTRMGTSRILISSDSRGEGALISEIARREKRPNLVVQPSSAELQRPDRLHGGIRPRFESSEDLAAWFPRSGFGMVVVDQSIAETDRSEIHDQLVSATEDHPEVFWPMAHIPITRSDFETQGTLTLYRVKESTR